MASGRVKVKTNWYSAPLAAGLRVTAAVWPSLRRDSITTASASRGIERCYGRGHQILNLEHYLDVLEKKPGAMAGSTPLEQWRQAGRWPECLDRIWQQLEQRHGKSGGTREMITLVRVGLSDGWDAADRGSGRGAAPGRHRCGGGAAHSAHAGRGTAPTAMQIALAEELAQFERPHAGDGRVRSAAGRSTAGKGSSNEEPDRSTRTRQRAAVLQSGAHADDRGQLRFASRAGREREP